MADTVMAFYMKKITSYASLSVNFHILLWPTRSWLLVKISPDCIHPILYKFLIIFLHFLCQKKSSPEIVEMTDTPQNIPYTRIKGVKSD